MSRPRQARRLQLAVLVQAYLALGPFLEQTDLLSGWVGKLAGLVCKPFEVQAEPSVASCGIVRSLSTQI